MHLCLYIYNCLSDHVCGKRLNCHYRLGLEQGAGSTCVEDIRELGTTAENSTAETTALWRHRKYYGGIVAQYVWPI